MRWHIKMSIIDHLVEKGNSEWYERLYPIFASTKTVRDHTNKCICLKKRNLKQYKTIRIGQHLWVGVVWEGMFAFHFIYSYIILMLFQKHQWFCNTRVRKEMTRSTCHLFFGLTCLSTGARLQTRLAPQITFGITTSADAWLSRILFSPPVLEMVSPMMF